MQVIPAVDLLGTEVVRLDQGDYDRVIFRHPLDDFVRRVSATNPPLLHVVDLDGARDGKVRFDVVRQCLHLASPIPVQVSGGIRSVAVAQAILNLGAARVIVGSAVWATVDGLATFVDALGECLVVALDVRDGRLATHGWLADADLDVDDALNRCVVAGVSRLHVTAIDRDGTMRGPDLTLYRRVCASGLAVVAAGGIRDDDDVAAVGAAGCEAAIMGVGYLRRIGLTLDAIADDNYVRGEPFFP